MLLDELELSELLEELEELELSELLELSDEELSLDEEDSLAVVSSEEELYWDISTL